MLNDQQLIDKSLTFARMLTYNEEPQSTAKMLIIELCHRLAKAIGCSVDSLEATEADTNE